MAMGNDVAGVRRWPCRLRLVCSFVDEVSKGGGARETREAGEAAKLNYPNPTRNEKKQKS